MLIMPVSVDMFSFTPQYLNKWFCDFVNLILYKTCANILVMSLLLIGPCQKLFKSNIWQGFFYFGKLGFFGL